MILPILSALYSVSCAWPTQGHDHLHHTRSTVTQSASSWSAWNASTASPGISWLPAGEKVRGVNLGSHFIIEKWMAYDEFNSMGCGDKNDEWQCVEFLGQEKADAVFDTHWNTWTTQKDISDIKSWGINVIRIPVGYWIKEDLVQADEFFPRGGLKYLDRIVGWAADAGLHVIIDLHGGPGVQYPDQQFTGRVSLRFLQVVSNIRQGLSTPGLYTAENYQRAVDFLEWMAERIHTNANYRTTGVLQVMNEPVHADEKYSTQAADMNANFYPAAYKAIRAKEATLGVSPSNELKVQFMGLAWGAGDPTSSLPDDASNLLFDDHKYYKWDPSVEKTKAGYISAVCNDDRGGDDTLIGEWSISVADGIDNTSEFAITGDGIDVEAQKKWYQQYWAAQVQTFEKSGGWIFWTYKCNWINGIDEWRWCFQSAVQNGVIPTAVSKAASLSPCN